MSDAPVYFYYNSIRQVTVQFLDLFNDFRIKRVVPAKTGAENKREVVDFRIPIIFSPLSRRAVDLLESLVFNQKRFSLPLMSFALTSYEVDTERMLPRIQYYYFNKETNITRYTYAPIPINIKYELEGWTEFMDDRLQIIEQITPLFNFHRIVEVRTPEPWGTNLWNWVFLEGIDQDDTLDYSNEERRILKVRFNFKVETYLFREEYEIEQKPITEINANMYGWKKDYWETIHVIGDLDTGEITNEIINK